MALSHRSAAVLWGIRTTARANVDVTSWGRTGRSRPGIEVHRATGLDERDVTTVERIPCTTVARTLLDLAEVVDRRALERACDRAEQLRIVDWRDVHETLSRTAGKHRAHLLKAAVQSHDIGRSLTRSELEERFLELCENARLEPPETNAWIPLDGGSGIEADFLWREPRLIVETDGFGTHGTRHAFESDRSRDQRLALAGWRVIRCTWRQVVTDPSRIAKTISALLGRPRPGPGSARADRTRARSRRG